MKKTALFIILVLASLALAVSLFSCASDEPGTLDTELGSTTGGLHFSQIEDSETASETVTETETETLTETEEVTVKETETEAKEEIPEESLRYTSYNNGTCAVSGIGSCADTFIVIPERSPAGDIVTGIEDRAFYGDTSIKALEIPSTVSSIGSMAFGNCGSLVYISVDQNNKMFKDINGILYSKDGSTLISYPSACGSSSVTISKSVTRIADMAFYNCHTLQTIIYEGTLADWGRITIGELNYGLFTASVVCGGK